jgi:FkbM family methyltransferase
MQMQAKKWVRAWANAFLFPVRSIVAERFSPCVFLPTLSGWRAYTRGTSFPVAVPGEQAVEYFRFKVPQKNNVVFDVGGELGLEMLQFSEMVGPRGKVFTFECFPEHLEKLQSLAREKSNVTVVPKACWNSSGSLDLITGHTPGSNTAIPEARGQRGQVLGNQSTSRISVDADTLDNMWRSLTGGLPVDFLKMDIEGAEYEALDGAPEMLAKTRYAVIAAYHMRNGCRTAWRVAQTLEEAGFDVIVGENLHVYATNRVRV